MPVDSEILGNNYNCMYRYNLSINDGHRIRGTDGAFQEGKILWLSGFKVKKKEKKGLLILIFIITIYSNTSMVSKIAIDNTCNGILIANNILFKRGCKSSFRGPI
jgi:hypothetical protein